MTETNINTYASDSQRPVISKWATVSMVLTFLCIIGILNFMFPFVFPCFLFPFLPLFALSTLFCGIVALVRIRKSKGLLRGKIYAIIGILISLPVMLLFSVSFLWVGKSLIYVWRLESKLKSPAIYEPAAKELTQYCQAVTTEVKDTGLGNAWYPETIRNLNPFYGFISPKSANIVFAGGFYHLGYHLNLDENASTEKESVWNLSIITESSEKYLCTVRLDKTNPFTMDKLIETAIAGYDSNPRQAHNKIIFLLVFERPEMAYEACKELTLTHPNSWWPRLTLTFMDAAKTDPDKAGDEFAAWVEKYPSFSHYYYLSFFYEKENDMQKACDTIEKSLEYPIKEEADDSPGARTVYSYASDSIGIALKNNKPELALRICDAALAGLEKEHGRYSPTPYWQPTIQKLKTAISANDVNTIDRWNQYKAWSGSFNPYQAGNTNAKQRIKIGSHFFPSDEDIKASERPFEEIESLTKEWLKQE